LKSNTFNEFCVIVLVVGPVDPETGAKFKPFPLLSLHWVTSDPLVVMVELSLASHQPTVLIRVGVHRAVSAV